MFPALSRTMLLLTMLAAPVAAAASEPQSRSDQARDQQAGQNAARAGRQAPVELVCRNIEIAGGAETAPMVCMTAAEWRRSEQ